MIDFSSSGQRAQAPPVRVSIDFVSSSARTLYTKARKGGSALPQRGPRRDWEEHGRALEKERAAAAAGNRRVIADLGFDLR